MSFIGKWIRGVTDAVGITDSHNAAPPAPVPLAPTTANSNTSMDLSAQKAAAAMQSGKTSTLMNGAEGVDDKRNTSKILLGA